MDIDSIVHQGTKLSFLTVRMYRLERSSTGFKDVTSVHVYLSFASLLASIHSPVSTLWNHDKGYKSLIRASFSDLIQDNELTHQPLFILR